MLKQINVWNKLSEPAKSSVVFLLALTVTKGIIFIATPVFTRMMGEADIGLVGSYTSWRGIFEIFSILSMTSSGVFNVGMSQFRDNRSKYISCAIGLCACTTIICSGLILICYRWWGGFFDLPQRLVYLMCIQSLLLPAQTFWVSKQRYEYKYRAAFWVTVLTALFSQGVAIVAVYFAHSNLAEVRLWAAACIELPVGIFFIILLIVRGKHVFNKTIWKETLLFAIPLIPHYLASIVLTASDRIMVYNLDSPDAAGIYTVAYGIGAIGSIIWGAIQGSFTPYVFDCLDNNKIDGIDKIANQLVLFFGLGCIFISMIAPEALKILGPSSYQIGAYAIPPVVGAVFISCLYNLFSLVEFYHKKSGFIALASMIAAGLNVILNIIFIPKGGFIAAGYTTLCAYIVLSLMHYINMKRIESIAIYNEKKLFGISFIILILCIICQVLYQVFLMRYLLCIGMIIVAIIKRDLIRKVIGRKK